MLFSTLDVLDSNTKSQTQVASQPTTQQQSVIKDNEAEGNASNLKLHRYGLILVAKSLNFYFLLLYFNLCELEII